MAKVYKLAVIMSLVALSLGVMGSLNSAYAQDTTETREFPAPRSTTTESLQDRLEGLVQQRQETLDAAKQERIAARCETAKEKIVAHKGKALAYKDKHSGVYVRITTRLATFITRVEAAGIDASALSAVVADFDKSLITLAADAALYEQTLGQLLAIDCSQDPLTFYETLQSVRVEHVDIVSQVKVLNESIRTAIKQELLVIKEALSAGSDAAETEEGA